VIESRAGGVLLAVALLALALLLVLVAPLHRRPAFIVVATCLAAASLYAGLRGWSLQSIAPSSVVGDPSQFVAQRAAHVAAFEEWAQGKAIDCSSAKALAESLWRHRDEILGTRFRTLFPAVLAAYGNAYLNEHGTAEWMIVKKQLVLGRPGRPWSRVWIERELHSLLDSDV
jgi:hypothetical protein